MRLDVHTARLPSPRAKIVGYRGPDVFNVTRRGGGAAADPFAPSDALLDAGLAYKRAAKKKSAPGVPRDARPVQQGPQPMHVTITTPGATVSADGPVEAADAIQRDAFEVRLLPPTGDEAARAGRILAEWLREQRGQSAG